MNKQEHRQEISHNKLNGQNSLFFLAQGWLENYLNRRQRVIRLRLDTLKPPQAKPQPPDEPDNGQ